MPNDEMPVGTSTRVDVIACEKMNATGVRVRRGQRYRLEATGIWNDGGIDTGPDGFVIDQDAPVVSRWLLKLCAPLLRYPGRNYFCLIGCTNGKSDTFFPIGVGLDWPVPSDGELACFANDVPFAYWNNRKSISLSITRLA